MSKVKHLAKTTIKGIHTYSFGLLKRLYVWTMKWAGTKYGVLALFIVAFSESSFFPLPPDVLLIALCVAIPKRSFWIALVASAGSVFGGMFGYYLGYAFFNSMGVWIIQTFHYQQSFEIVGNMYQANAFLAILLAAFTPIPYKVFTLAAGFFKVDFWTMVFASTIGRSLRFFILATLLFFFGAKIKEAIDKYFNLFTLIVMGLVIGGFVIIKYVM